MVQLTFTKAVWLALANDDLSRGCNYWFSYSNESLAAKCIEAAAFDRWLIVSRYWGRGWLAFVLVCSAVYLRWSVSSILNTRRFSSSSFQFEATHPRCGAQEWLLEAACEGADHRDCRVHVWDASSCRAVGHSGGRTGGSTLRRGRYELLFSCWSVLNRS